MNFFTDSLVCLFVCLFAVFVAVFGLFVMFVRFCFLLLFLLLSFLPCSTYPQLKRHESTKRRAYFEESDSYWDPGNSYEALYDQFARKKFREILREDIQ